MIKDILQRLCFSTRRACYGGIVGAVFLLVMDKGNNSLGWKLLGGCILWIVLSLILENTLLASRKNSKYSTKN